MQWGGQSTSVCGLPPRCDRLLKAPTAESTCAPIFLSASRMRSSLGEASCHVAPPSLLRNPHAVMQAHTTNQGHAGLKGHTMLGLAGVQMGPQEPQARALAGRTQQ